MPLLSYLKSHFPKIFPSASSSSTTNSNEHERPEDERKTYVAYPKNSGLNDDVNRRMYEQLAAIAGPSRIRAFDTKTMGVDFWHADFTDEEAIRAREIPEVKLVQIP